MKKEYTKKENTNTKIDLLKNRYVVADRNTFWTIDATYINSGVLIIVIDLATRLIIGHMYLHRKKANEFLSSHIISLLNRCIKARNIHEPDKLTIHSDRGFQFTSNEFIDFSKQQGFQQSLNEKPLNNQVSESLNNKVKKLLRLKLEPFKLNKNIKSNKEKDTLTYLNKLKKQTILQTIQFAIDEHNNEASTHNKEITPFNLDNALFDSNRKKPAISAASTKDAVNAEIVEHYRESVVFDYAIDWAQFYNAQDNKQDIQFEIARRERAFLYEQNRTLQATIEKQGNQIERQNYLIEKQSEQLKELLDFQREKLKQITIKEQLKAKKAAAKKQPPRDLITPQEFKLLLNSIKLNSLKYARIKVALVLLYITGLRVANLRSFQVRHLLELLNKQSTTILINKRGGIRKIIIGKQCKQWFKLIQINIETLIENKQEDQNLFTNRQGQIVSREQFNKDINQALKEFSGHSGKILKSHSFRIALITDLLQDNTIQEVRNIIGHQDIRTTDTYNRRFMTERECYNALQSLAKKRTKTLNLDNKNNPKKLTSLRV
jgi:site-specific recombinase XerD/transposase InsO family protein